MMWYDGGWSWFWMTLMMLIVWSGLIVVAGRVVRSGVSSRRERDTMDVLRRRLAAGEISQEDFEKTKRILQA